MPETALDPTKNVVRMPERSQMVEQLREAGIYGTGLDVEKLLDNFTQRVAGSEKTGPQIVTAWSLACFDEYGVYAHEVSPTVQLRFDGVVDAVISDPVVTATAKQAMETALEEQRKIRR